VRLHTNFPQFIPPFSHHRNNGSYIRPLPAINKVYSTFCSANPPRRPLQPRSLSGLQRSSRQSCSSSTSALEPTLRSGALCQGRLADALLVLVSVLHGTVLLLNSEVLAHIPAHMVSKAAGWWCVMFGPHGNTGRSVYAPSSLRHVLDFCRLTGSRVVVFLL
jgi:hypothetical protein